MRQKGMYSGLVSLMLMSRELLFKFLLPMAVLMVKRNLLEIWTKTLPKY